ncbi:unnamed protein product [Lactuca saligna]|uniref:Uncharacterized protein n=1 Tax=Lactuca saligna TaxID=75948 RepID=A0AA35Y3S0_LACSI|nr:unnamed protein product [Lactuca saligna]
MVQWANSQVGASNTRGRCLLSFIEEEQSPPLGVARGFNGKEARKDNGNGENGAIFLISQVISHSNGVCSLQSSVFHINNFALCYPYAFTLHLLPQPVVETRPSTITFFSHLFPRSSTSFAVPPTLMLSDSSSASSSSASGYQIPFGRKSMLEAYVDIVFRAWKAANGETREEISWKHMQALVDISTHEQGY